MASFVDNFYATQRQGEALDADKIANQEALFKLGQAKLLAEQAQRFYAAQAAPVGVKPAMGVMPSGMPGGPTGAIGEVPNAAAESQGLTMPGAPPMLQPPTALQMMRSQVQSYDDALAKLSSVKDTPQGFAASQALMKERAAAVEKMTTAQKDQFDEDRKAAQDNLDKWAGVKDQQSLNYTMASAPPEFKTKLAQAGIFPVDMNGRYDYNDPKVQQFVKNAQALSLTQVQRLEQEKRAADIVNDQTQRVQEQKKIDETIRSHNMIDARERERIAIEREKIADAKTLTPDDMSIAEKIARGEMKPFEGYAARAPKALAIMAQVSRINPSYDAKDYGTTAAAEKAFTSGKLGNQVRSFNVAVSHLDSLSKLADALDNKDTQLINKIGNYYAEKTGSPAPTNFDAAKKVVGDEIVKAIVGSGGGVADREEAAKTLDKANSPAQLKGVISTYMDLMKGQLSGLEKQYQVSTKKNDFKERFLTDAAKMDMGTKGVTTIKSDADYASLPSGAEFIAPDGSHRKKP